MVTHIVNGTNGNNLFGPYLFTTDDYVVNGQGGNDTLDAAGTNGRDYLDLSREAGVARLAIQPRATTGDSVFAFRNVEEVVLRAGRGEDTVDIANLNGLGINHVTVDLSSPTGGTDRATDRVSVDGTGLADSIRLTAVDGTLGIRGLAADVDVIGGDADLDKLHVDAGAGDDVIDASGVFGLRPTPSPFYLSGDAGNDKVVGSSGGDFLYGGAGTDTLIGGSGHDTYVNPLGDVIVESANGGVDTVLSAVSFSLAGIANVERLTLTGVSDADGTGNALNNLIRGNVRDNVLRGVLGDDVLIGDRGHDTLDGGDGQDLMTGGTGRDEIRVGNDTQPDIVRYLKPLDSTGGFGHDVVIGMDLNDEDLFNIPTIPTSISPTVSGGVLNEGGAFNTQLAAAVSASLPAGGAVLFDPSSGTADRPNSIYLVIDANGVDGYQARADYVIELQNWTGTLDLTDFIGQ